MVEDTTPYPKLLTCSLCQAQHHTEHRDDWTTWANSHHAEHIAKNEYMVYTVVPLAAVKLAPLIDIGGGMRVYEHPERGRTTTSENQQETPDA